MTRILPITAGRGGVGRTTLALNLASGLKNFGVRVVLVDTEAHLPALGYDTNFFTNTYTLLDVASGIDLAQALRDLNGIKYLIGAWNSTEFKKIPSERILEVVDDLSHYSDYIIFDSPLTREAINLLEATKEVMFVTRPLVEEIGEVQKLNDVMDGKGVGLMLNMIRGVRGELSPKAIEFLTQTPVIGQVPYDKHVLLALSARKPVVEFYPNCSASRGIVRFISEYVKGKVRFFQGSIETSVQSTTLNLQLRSLSKKIDLLETQITTIERELRKKTEPIIIE